MPDLKHAVADQLGTWSIPALGPKLPQVEVVLENMELWQQFHKETTEMIITKSGRRMYPLPQLKITGLDYCRQYHVLVEMVPIGNHRQKYVGNANAKNGSGRGNWMSTGPAEQQSLLHRRLHVHPESPALGAYWMKEPVKFTKLKITNDVSSQHDHILLTSMHKYNPRIWIYLCDTRITTIDELYTKPAATIMFKETEFIAVTAYQNDNITKLKINNNPFAKGFRENGQSRSKHKSRSTSWIKSWTSAPTDDEESNSELNRDALPLDDASSPSQSSETNETVKRETEDNVDARAESFPAMSPESTATMDDSEDETPPLRLHRPWLNKSSRSDRPLLNVSMHDSRSIYPIGYMFPFSSQWFHRTPFYTQERPDEMELQRQQQSSTAHNDPYSLYPYGP